PTARTALSRARSAPLPSLPVDGSRRQFETPRDDPRNGDVLVQCLPPQRVAIHFHHHIFQFFLGSRGKPPETIRGEPYDPAVVKLDIDGSTVRPRTNRGGFGEGGAVNDGVCHNTLASIVPGARHNGKR